MSNSENQRPEVDGAFSVAVNAPLSSPLTYLWKQPFLKRGQPVTVPLGRRKVDGVVLGPGKPIEIAKMKSIVEVHPERPLLGDTFTSWLEWLADYYQHPLGQVLNLAYPPLKKSLKPRKSKRTPVIPIMEKSYAPTLTPEQNHCISSILKTPGFAAHLLFGVTGSGKTEVYLHLLEDILKNGQQGLVLVPEISLTPQLIKRFAARFGDSIAVIHSHLTEREKTNQWWEIIDGKKKILIGARSALFCPIPNLGLIVIDEEHESSFKQDEKLKYHARDTAIMRAKFESCPIVLGSATPSMETWANATSGKYHLHNMPNRVENRAMPEIHVVDMRVHKDKRRNTKENLLPFWLSPLLYENIKDHFSRGEQSALFLNRRGIAQMVFCPGCGHIEKCPNCAVSLTLHAKSHLLCHYCDYHQDLKELCPSCRDQEIKPLGLGTELIEADLRKLFPTARIARADRDEIQNREDLENFISDIEDHNVDIIVGTQMIAKGLDFKGLNLVGLVLADVGFNLPDFRCSERSFQLILQVSGRAGRHITDKNRRGQVIIQTYNPEHFSLKFAVDSDFQGFAEKELEFRNELMYPPFGRLIAIRIKGPQQKEAYDFSEFLSTRAQLLKKRHPAYEAIEILGPAEAPLSRLKGQYRYHLLIKGPSSQLVGGFCKQLNLTKVTAGTKCKIQVDVDPMNLL